MASCLEIDGKHNKQPMIRAYLLALCSFIFSSVNSQSLIGAKQFHGNDAQMNTSSAVDADGNIFTVSNFWDDLDADPGPGTLNFNAVASMDFAIIKLDNAGDLVWAKQIGGTGFDGCYKIELNSSGEVFAFGYFNGTIDMDPGPGTYNLISSGSDEVFCGKYDADGNLLWAAKFGGTGTEQSYGLALNSADHVFVHGYFQNTVDFDPGPGTFNMTAAVSGSDFLVELNDDGSFVNAIKMSASYGNYMICNNADAIFIAGLFWGTMDFDPGPGVSNLTAAGFGADAFLLKLNSDLSFAYAVKFSGNDDEQATVITYDELNNDVIVGGFYQGTMDANPGGATNNLISAGYVDGFIIKLNDDGSYIWSASFGGLGYQTINGIGIDAGGDIHATGPFEQTADFDPSGSVFNLTSAGYTDIFRVILHNDGTFSTAEKIGSTMDDWSNSLYIDDNGVEYLTGYFDGTVDFDPGPGTFNLNSAFTGWDGFLSWYCTTYTVNVDVAICAGESYFAGGAFQTTAGDYYDYFDPVNGCDSVVITHLSVNSPVVNLGADDGICDGSTLILDAGNPGADFLWNTGATTQTITVSEAGNYSVTITDAAGCSANDAIAIELFPSPAVNLGPDISACADEVVVLDAGNAGDDFLWSTGAITQTIDVASTGNYFVTVTNGDGCSDSDIIHVTINPLPVVEIGDAIDFCSDENVMLDAGNPGSSYLWNTGATTQTITTGDPGIYSVEVTNVNGCSATDDVVLTEHAVPVVDLGDDLSVCDGETITLDAGNTGSTYVWTTGETTQTINITESGNYGVTVTNEFGCDATDIMMLIVNPVPFVELGDEINICEGENAILDAENPGASYVWTTGETTQQINADESGVFGVTITNDSGCSFYDDVTVNINPSPVIDLGSDTAFCEGSSIILDATIESGSYFWSTSEITPTIEVGTSGTYSVLVENEFGCTTTDTIEVEVYPSPEIEFELATSVCSDAGPITLTATPSGGTFSGTGVSGDIFDPAVSGPGTFSISYTYTDANGCTATSVNDISVEICQGIEDPVFNNMQIFPNPSDDDIAIIFNNIPNGNYQFAITDMTGKICFENQIQFNQNKANLFIGFLPSGNYLLEIMTEKGSVNKLITIAK